MVFSTDKCTSIWAVNFMVKVRWSSPRFNVTSPLDASFFCLSEFYSFSKCVHIKQALYLSRQ